ncbi:MAG: oxidoreductase, partial [Actinobacteria bacterium]|nr:oxidoreductase [Actinomycetota bacterium]
APGYPLELRGPVGGWFVWDRGSPAPVLLVAGGSGIVPLMAMIRARAGLPRPPPFRLVYSAREPATVLYAAEISEREGRDDGLRVRYAYTRRTPPGWPVPAGRISAELLTTAGWPPDQAPSVFVCGPTGFVEAAAGLLVAAGHEPGRIKTERFGPTGG